MKKILPHSTENRVDDRIVALRPAANDAIKSERIVMVTPAEWVRPSLMPHIFGLTEESVKKHRLRGRWLDGLHFKKTGKREYWYNVTAITEWINSCDFIEEQ